MKPLAASCCLIGLIGCGGIQNHAGINHALIEFQDDGKPRSVEIIGGKEADRIDASFRKGDIDVQYSVRNQRAFEAHAIRGEVEKVLTEQLGQAAPELV